MIVKNGTRQGYGKGMILPERNASHSGAFKDSRDVGAPRDYRLLIYFGKSEAVRIDTDSITEIFEQ